MRTCASATSAGESALQLTLQNSPPSDRSREQLRKTSLVQLVAYRSLTPCCICSDGFCKPVTDPIESPLWERCCGRGGRIQNVSCSQPQHLKCWKKGTWWSQISVTVKNHMFWSGQSRFAFALRVRWLRSVRREIHLPGVCTCGLAEGSLGLTWQLLLC